MIITSPESAAGKTAICAGLGRYLISQGKKAGYLKVSTGQPDGDAGFIKDALGLSESVESLSPKTAGVKDAAAKLGKDVVIIEVGSAEYKSVPEIARSNNAGVIVIETWSSDLSKSPAGVKELGKSLLGVILNKVPKNRVQQAREAASGAGIKVLGVIPEDRTLEAITIGELAESIQGEVLSHNEKADELVENVMLGALALDPGPSYFIRKENKAVVLKSGRPDLQMAVLETPTRCLVLTGDARLNQAVVGRADEKEVPLILNKESDNSEVAENIEDAFLRGRFHQTGKLARITELMEENLDMPSLAKGSG